MNVTNVTVANGRATGALRPVGGEAFRGGGQFLSMPEDQAAALRAAMNMPAPRVTREKVVAKPKPPAAPVQASTPPEPARTRVSPLVVITSGKGGVGKTNTAVNVCVMLAACGVKVSLIDADLGLANADVLCGVSPTTRLDSVIGQSNRGDATGVGRGIAAIAVDAPGGFKLVPGAVGSRRVTALSGAERSALIESFAALDAASELVVVDTGAGIADGVTDFVRAADVAVVVVTPEPTSVADAYAIIKSCYAPRGEGADGRTPTLAVMVNQVRSRDEGSHVYQRIAATCERFLGVRPILLGMLPVDEAVPAAVRRRTPVCLAFPSAPVAHEFGRVAGEIAKLCGVKGGKPAKPAAATPWWMWFAKRR